MATVSAGFDELHEQLRMMNALLARQVQHVQDVPQRELVLILSQAGGSPGEIARVLGTTVNTVQVTLSRYKSTMRRASKKVKPESKTTDRR